MAGAPGVAARAHLFAPGSQARLLAKVFEAGADAVVLDLEDAVAPAAKAEARGLVAAAVAGRAGRPRPLVAVRINGLDTSWWRDDLDAVVGPGLSVVRVPKAETRDHLDEVGRALDRIEARTGLDARSIGIVPTIESAAGLLNVPALSGAPRVRAFAFGATDFVRDIGADPAAADEATRWARQYLVVASRAAGLAAPIASVHTAVKDLDGLRRSTEEARAIGFFGRSCIHPSQVPIVQAVFTPAAAEVDAAREVLAAWDRELARGVAAFTLPGGQFVDEAVARRARAVVALADAIARGPDHDPTRG